MKLGMRAVLVAAVAGSAAVAIGQTTGVSHPEEVPVTTSPEGIAQPVVYEAPASVVVVPAGAVATAQPSLRQRTPADEPVYTPTPAASPAQEPARQVAIARPEPIAEPVQESLHEQQAAAAHTAAYDPDGDMVHVASGPANQLPHGAMLKVRLLQALSTGNTQPGSIFTAELIDPMQHEGRILLPAGSLVRGKVTDVHAGKRVSGPASIHLQTTSITLPDGTRYDLRAQVVDTDLYRSDKVDEEGNIVRKDHVKGTAAALGLATGSGMAAGAVFGGWPGAIVGGAIGAGVGTVVWLKAGHQAELPAGAEITFGLTQPLTVGQQ